MTYVLNGRDLKFEFGKEFLKLKNEMDIHLYHQN